MLLLAQRAEVFRFSFNILHMPLCLKVLALLKSSSEKSCFSTGRAFNCLLLILFFYLYGFLVLLLYLFLFIVFPFLFDTLNQLECAELLGLEAFVFLVNDNANQNFNYYLIEFFADLVNLSVFIWFDVISSDQLSALFLFFLELFNLQCF